MMTTPRYALGICSLLSLGLILGAGCSHRKPLNPVADDGVIPDAGALEPDGAMLFDGPRARDGSISSCSANSQCGPGRYCAFPTGTCGKVPGTCTKQPSPECPEYYSPVCGCDGKTYSNTCFSASKGISVQHLGTCKTKETCSKLDQQYMAEVKKAKVCGPMLPVVQCQLKVDDALNCACPTYVEKSNTQAVAALKKIKQQFVDAGCNPGLCGKACMAAIPGKCGGPTPPGAGMCQ